MEYDGSTTESEYYDEPETLSDVETPAGRTASTMSAVATAATSHVDASVVNPSTATSPATPAAPVPDGGERPQGAAARKRVLSDSDTQAVPPPKQARGDAVPSPAQTTDVEMVKQPTLTTRAGGDTSRPSRPPTRKCPKCSRELLVKHLRRGSANVPHWRCVCCQQELVKAAYGGKPPKTKRPKCRACSAAPPAEMKRKQQPVAHVEPVDPQTLETLRRIVADANKWLPQGTTTEGSAALGTLRKRFNRLQEQRNGMHSDGQFLGDCDDLREDMREEIVMAARYLDQCELNLLTRQAQVCAALHVKLGHSVPPELQRVISAECTSGDWVATALQPTVTNVHPRLCPETREFLRDYRRAARQKQLEASHQKFVDEFADPEKLRVLRDAAVRAVELLSPHLRVPGVDVSTDNASGSIPTPDALALLESRYRRIQALRNETNPNDVLSRDGGELSLETRDEARAESRRLDAVEVKLRTHQLLLCVALLKQHGHAVPSDVERVVVEHATGNWRGDVLRQKVVPVGVGLSDPAQAELKSYRRRLRLLEKAEAIPETDPQTLQELRATAKDAESLLKTQGPDIIGVATAVPGAPNGVLRGLQSCLQVIHNCRSLIYAGDTFLGDCPDLSDAVRREAHAERRRLDSREVLFLVRLVQVCGALLLRCGQVLPPSVQRIVDENATDNWETEVLTRKVSRPTSQLTEHAQSVLSAKQKELEVTMDHAHEKMSLEDASAASNPSPQEPESE